MLMKKVEKTRQVSQLSQARTATSVKGCSNEGPGYGLDWLGSIKNNRQNQIIARKAKYGKKKPKVSFLSESDYQKVKPGIEEANNMADSALKWLVDLKKSLLNQLMGTKLTVFRNHFKTVIVSDVFDVQELILRFKDIQNALKVLNRDSFRKVDIGFCAKADEPPGTQACVFGKIPVIYLVKGNIFFPESEVQEDSPNVETMGPWASNSEMMGRVLVHEVAHYSLGIKHKGGEFNFGESWPQGLPLKNSIEAFLNAYTYDNFAYCIYKKLVE
jgi:hypothetical protein